MGVVAEHTTEIDGITYTTQTFPAAQGLKIAHRLARLIDANRVGDALLGVEVNDLESIFASAGMILDLVIGAAHAVDADEFVSTIHAILMYVKADKIKVGDATAANASVVTHFDTHFAGRYQHMLGVVVWAARVGFGGP